MNTNEFLTLGKFRENTKDYSNNMPIVAFHDAKWYLAYATQEVDGILEICCDFNEELPENFKLENLGIDISKELLPQMKIITLEKYNELIADQNFLNRLYAAGVDNWEGFSECQDGEDDADSN